MSGTWANVEKIQKITVWKRIRWLNTFFHFLQQYTGYIQSPNYLECMKTKVFNR